MKLKVLTALGCTLALIAVAIYSYFEADGYNNFVTAAVVAFWFLIAAGVVVRLIRARRGRKIREAISPVAGAADAYQSLLLSKPPAAESAKETAKHIATDKFTSGQ